MYTTCGHVYLWLSYGVAGCIQAKCFALLTRTFFIPVHVPSPLPPLRNMFLHHYELVNVVTLFIGYHASTGQIRLLNTKRSSTLFETG